MTVGIYYATTTGKTEDVADRLHNFISSAEAPKDVSDVDDLSEFEGLDGIICGIPTWNTGADEERSGTAWDSILEDIGELSLSGKKSCHFWFRRFFHIYRKLL
jgi:flavodoxin I